MKLFEFLYFCVTDDTVWLHRRWQEKIKRARRRPRVRAPRFLYRLHGKITARKFIGHTVKLRHRVALHAVRFTLDRFELYQFYGRPW